MWEEKKGARRRFAGSGSPRDDGRDEKREGGGSPRAVIRRPGRLPPAPRGGSAAVAPRPKKKKKAPARVSAACLLVEPLFRFLHDAPRAAAD